jgi:hypothetical protein
MRKIGLTFPTAGLTAAMAGLAVLLGAAVGVTSSAFSGTSSYDPTADASHLWAEAVVAYKAQ